MNFLKQLGKTINLHVNFNVSIKINFHKSNKMKYDGKSGESYSKDIL